MNTVFSSGAAFRACLRSDPEASRFYEGCTAQQRHAIHNQLRMLNSEGEVRHFTAHLPSAAL